jgi:hypothetical protein
MFHLLLFSGRICYDIVVLCIDENVKENDVNKNEVGVGVGLGGVFPILFLGGSGKWSRYLHHDGLDIDLHTSLFTFPGCALPVTPSSISFPGGS